MEQKTEKKRQRRQAQILECELHHIPMDIIYNILSRLPFKSAVQFRIVCKEWNFAISDPRFRYTGNYESVCVMEDSCKGVSFHSIGENGDRSAITSPQFKPGSSNIHVSNSCNGVVLICLDITVILFNPTTRYFVNVLTIDHSNILSLGLCYDESDSDYKAVILFSECDDPVNDGQYVIQTSLKGKQSRKSRFPFYFDHRAQGGPFVKGRLHWLCTSNSDDDIYLFAGRKIVSFDPILNVFQELSSPPRNGGVGNAILGLGVIEGCLWMTRVDDARKGVEILNMREYGVAESWTSMFILSMSQLSGYYNLWSLIPLLVTTANEILLIQSNKVVLAYNFVTKLYRKYYSPKVRSLSAVAFVENIVTLQGEYNPVHLRYQYY